MSLASLRAWSAERPVLLLAAAVTLARVLLACALGPGDAEALYAMYARHLQLGYLDHAPLVGWLQRAAESLGPSELGVGAAGLPHGLALRLVPIGCWCLSLLAVCDLARTLRPGDRRAPQVAGVAFVVCPMFLVGGLAAAPDAPMSAAWLGALALGARVVAAPDAPRSGPRVVAVGALVGLATLAKYSGVLLGLAFVLFAGARPEHRFVARRPSSWWGALTALVLASPPLVWNLTHDWASLRHRVSWTQSEAGFSLRNAGALVGGQLAYLTPLVALVGLALLRALWRERRASPAQALVAAAVFAPLLPLVVLCLWSKVAEPHWLLPVWLPLPAVLPGVLASPAGARARLLRPGFLRAAAVTGLALVAALHLHVLTDLAPRLLPPSLYDPRFDLAHDLRGWPEVAAAVEREARARRIGVVLAAHWTTCAQLDLALHVRRAQLTVGCVTAERDDYDLWSPNAPRRRPALFVVDGRWSDDPRRRAPRGARVLRTVELERGGRVVRRFALALLPR